VLTPVLEVPDEDENGELAPMLGDSKNGTMPPAWYGGEERKVRDYDHHHDDDSDELPAEIMALITNDADDAVWEAELFSDELSGAMLNTDRARRSLVRECVVKRASCTASAASSEEKRAEEEGREYRVSVTSMGTAASLPPATISSLWSQRNVRLHMMVYWFASFIMVEVDEAFPLFCMSVASGLGIKENAIGKIMSFSGLVFFIVQLGFYAPLIARTGLYGSILFGAVAMAPLAALIPFSVMMNRNADPGEVTWAAFGFLTVLMAFSRVFGLTFFSGITVAINRLVPAQHRATLNGLNTLGGSGAKALGPAFAGVLVSFFFSSGLFAPRIAPYLLYGSIGICMVVNALTAFLFLHDPDDAEGEATHDRDDA